MKLTTDQLAQFDRDGYLFFPALFTPAEVQTLTDEVPRLGPAGREVVPGRQCAEPVAAGDEHQRAVELVHLAEEAIDNAAIAALVESAGGRAGGIHAPKGPAGSRHKRVKYIAHRDSRPPRGAGALGATRGLS